MDKKFLIYDGLDSERIDKFLANELEDLSRSSIQMLIKDKQVLVNEEVVKANFLLKNGDEISITIPDPVNDEILAEDIPLDVYYEDSDVIVINKPSGMVVHPAVGNTRGTLVNALMYHCKDLSGINGVIRAGIVHRIDKDTSGLLVACKNDKSHQHLSEQFFNKTVKRKYYAICYGEINHNLGKIDAPIGRDLSNRQTMTVVDGGKHAITHFKVLERFKGFTLLELVLETGRTHQIRVHMKHINHPLVGDQKYGNKNSDVLAKKYGLKGNFLHAKRLCFHNLTGSLSYLNDKEFIAPLFDWEIKLINRLKKGN